MEWPKTHHLTLPDDRRLAYLETGDLSGAPVFYFHGWPACRYESCLYAPAAKANQVRLIAVDRPGMGQSDYLAKRTLLDWPSDLKALANHLDLGTFRVLGHSGGGPYALSSAAALPDEILEVIIMAGVSPMNDPRTRDGMRKMNQFLLTIGRFCPPILDMIMKIMRKMATNPEKLKKAMADLPEVDRQVIEQYLPQLVEATQECFSQGTRGATLEGVIYSKPWDIDLGSIKMPVTIWQGDQDVNVPQSNSHLLSEKIPEARLNIVEGEGHLSMPINQGDQIFRNLMGAK